MRSSHDSIVPDCGSANPYEQGCRAVRPVPPVKVGGRAAPPHPLGRVVGRYTLFQLPELLIVGIVLVVLVQLEQVTNAMAAALGAAWVAKEVAMFPFVRRAYEPSNTSPADSLVGARAVVISWLAAKGTVRLGAELWNARIDPAGETPQIGASVRVRAVERLTLLVAPEEMDGIG